MPTEVADRLYFSLPNGVASLLSMQMHDDMARAEPDRFDALEKAGFKVKRGGDVFHHLIERAGGHYVDVGCSKLISDGKVCLSPRRFCFREGSLTASRDFYDFMRL